MPIIGTVGRKSLKIRVLNALIHLVLILGATTMIYPMLLMLSGSVKSNVDKNEMNPIPPYFMNQEILFRKYVESKYNEKIALSRMAHRKNYFSFENVEEPDSVGLRAVEDWRDYLEAYSLGVTEYELGFTASLGILPKNTRNFKRTLQEKYDDDIDKLNDSLGTFYNTWWEMVLSPEFLHNRSASLDFGPMKLAFHEFKKTRPLRDKYVYSLSGLFVEEALKPQYTSRIEKLNEALGTSFASYRQVNLAREVPTGPLREDWEHFVRNMLSLQYVKVRSAESQAYREFLEKQYSGSIEDLNKIYKSDYEGFADVEMPEQLPSSGIAYADWEYFIANTVSSENLYLEAPEFQFRDFLQTKYGNIDSLNHLYEIGYDDFSEVSLPESSPKDNCVMARDWLDFVRTEISYVELFLSSAAAPDYLVYLAKIYGGDPSKGIVAIENLNKAYGTHYDSTLDIVMPSPPYQLQGQALKDWKRFALETANTAYYEIEPEKHQNKWVAFLREKYSSIKDLNKQWGRTYLSFEWITPPYLEADWQDMLDNKSEIFWEFATRNYKMVLEYLVFHGRGLLNTVIYCGLSVLALLVINPLAAYALSRYKLPSSYKILLFCMLTMTFPPIVLGIPNFLLLKKLGLLNTFAALILPAMANGYSIFLLKGFFDSLPPELYEAATIDGASEFTMFWTVTMALSKPILAVIALHGFTRAYSNFMFAFIVCQDERMWTLMVWLYQLQQMASQPVVFASLLVAAIPTLLLFIFCQNIIMRGIVVPVEK